MPDVPGCVGGKGWREGKGSRLLTPKPTALPSSMKGSIEAVRSVQWFQPEKLSKEEGPAPIIHCCSVWNGLFGIKCALVMTPQLGLQTEKTA